MYHDSLSYHDDDDDGNCEFDSVCSESVMSMGSRLTDVTAECHLHVVPHTTLFTAIILLLLHHDGDDDWWSDHTLVWIDAYYMQSNWDRAEWKSLSPFVLVVADNFVKTLLISLGRVESCDIVAYDQKFCKTLLIIMGRVKIKRCCCRRSENKMTLLPTSFAKHCYLSTWAECKSYDIVAENQKFCQKTHNL